jgi:cytochrome c oxidase subunit 2
MDHSNALEITWSVVPLILLIGLFVVGFKDFVNLKTAPLDSYEIHAKGQKWKWTFQYPNGWVDDSLHVPKDKNVRIIISSADVLHSLFIPEFRVKMDAVPGRYTELWFNSTMTGTYPVYCTEYCGTSHSDMITRIVVHEPAEFEKWLEEVELVELSKPPIELGEIAYTKFGCATCHSTDGTMKTGPTFKGLWGKSETLADGTNVTVDENYIRESIMEPQAKIVKGFAPAMPTFKGQVKDEHITGLIEYIKSQK